MNKYNSIKRLIDLWEEFEGETNQLNMLDFADWLTAKLKEQPELDLKEIKTRNKNSESDYNQLFRTVDDSLRFLEYTSRISRLHEFYIKKFFGELPINSRLEYLFLYAVNEKKQAKKTELINIFLIDYTTGMDIIKRLVKNGFLEEKNDLTDKRAKLLVITPQGISVLEQAVKKMNDEIYMFLTCISANKWKKTLSVLEEINLFHSEVYQNHNDKNPAELLNLVDSLKYLYR